MISILLPLYIRPVTFYITLTKITYVICFRSGFRVSVHVKVSYSYWIYEDEGEDNAEKVIGELRKSESW